MRSPILHRIPGLPSQRRFYGSTAQYKGLSGPVGSGKTYALCHEALRAACRNPGCAGLVGGPTYPHLHDVTIPTLVGILEELPMPFRLWEGGRPRIYLERQGVLIIFRSLENPDRLRGLNLAWFGIDELTYCKAEAWKVLCQQHPASESQEPGRLRRLDAEGLRLGLSEFHLAETQAARL
jgi:hypothetical protein